MKTASVTRIALAIAVAFCLTMVVAGCRGIPDGTAKQTAVGSLNLQAKGAGIVSADAQNVTFKIKCGLCGFEPVEPMVIPTPEPGKPYTIVWICPRCGHKQTIVITAGS